MSGCATSSIAHPLVLRVAQHLLKTLYIQNVCATHISEALSLARRVVLFTGYKICIKDNVQSILAIPRWPPKGASRADTLKRRLSFGLLELVLRAAA